MKTIIFFFFALREMRGEADIKYVVVVVDVDLERMKKNVYNK